MDIDGYGDLPDTDEGRDHAFAMRHDRLVLLANLFQRFLVDVAVENGTLALDAESDGVLFALHRDKAVPFEGIPRSVGHNLASVTFGDGISEGGP
jgi:hypothetical protein